MCRHAVCAQSEFVCDECVCVLKVNMSVVCVGVLKVEVSVCTGASGKLKTRDGAYADSGTADLSWEENATLSEATNVFFVKYGHGQF